MISSDQVGPRLRIFLAKPIQQHRIAASSRFPEAESPLGRSREERSWGETLSSSRAARPRVPSGEHTQSPQAGAAWVPSAVSGAATTAVRLRDRASPPVQPHQRRQQERQLEAEPATRHRADRAGSERWQRNVRNVLQHRKTTGEVLSDEYVSPSRRGPDASPEGRRESQARWEVHSPL